MKMKKTYYLNKDVLPTIPVPHDCIIKKIRIEHKWLIFTFGNDTSYYDSVRKLSPNIRNLILKYHLSNPEDFSVYKCSKTLKRILNKECYIRQNTRKITKLPRKRLEYLYHNVGYCSIITKLHSDASVMIDAGVDYLVYEWIE